MTETNVEQDVQFTDATIGDLRALAKSYGIKAQRDWTRKDLIHAIAERQQEGDVPHISSVDDEADRLIARYSLPSSREKTGLSAEPKPGFARVVLHRDSTPGHANSPVQVGLNGRMFNVPRGISVDLPIPYLGVLRDAVHKVRRQIKEPNGEDLEGVIKEEEILSYPFQIVSVTPGGKFTNNEDQRAVSARRRKAFHDEIQRWPTDGELIEWEKAKAMRHSQQA